MSKYDALDKQCECDSWEIRNYSYSFRNDLRLTPETGDFVEKIVAAKINGGGGDGPEACGDALAQVVECDGEIGWRDNTRRVVLVATDDAFHVAGVGVCQKSLAQWFL